MTSLTRPRGPLPPRVYWVRRVAVLAVALVLVVGVSMALKWGADGKDGTAQADTAAVRQASGDPTGPSERAKDPAPTTGASTEGTTTPASTPTPTELATPSGPCRPEDIVATPTVAQAVADSPVTLQISLSTRESEACTWRVSPGSLTLKITSSKQDIWFSTECRRAVARQDVVLRKAIPTVVQVTWVGRYSDETCSDRTGWALPGWYDLSAAAFGGEPSTTRFRLVRPAATTVTMTPDPSTDPSGAGSDGAAGGTGDRAKTPSDGRSRPTEHGSRPGGSPSGAVEPNG